MTVKRSNKKVVVIAALVSVGMFGFGFALVPLYQVFCKVTGLNGKGNGVSQATSHLVDNSRTITMQFVATGNQNLPWSFYPVTKQIRIHPGAVYKIEYFAKNNSDHAMIIQAIPSVTPGIASKYLKKMECFCFTQQSLQKGESKNMPVVFQIDTHLPADINTITLSYTLFDLTDQLYEKKNSKT